jgi:hypothetical protein
VPKLWLGARQTLNFSIKYIKIKKKGKKKKIEFFPSQR